jgi:hypothetical protein
MMRSVIFKKEYSGESLCDLDRDISEAIDEHYNMDMAEIPKDEYGFPLGDFKVTIEWEHYE